MNDRIEPRGKWAGAYSRRSARPSATRRRRHGLYNQAAGQAQQQARGSAT